jgi:hypothetical protein
MALTNAERQKLYRERLKARAASAADSEDVAALKAAWLSKRKVLERQLSDLRAKAKEEKEKADALFRDVLSLGEENRKLRSKLTAYKKGVT